MLGLVLGLALGLVLHSSPRGPVSLLVSAMSVFANLSDPVGFWLGLLPSLY